MDSLGLGFSDEDLGCSENPTFRVLDDMSIIMGVSKNTSTPKSSSLIGFSIINHPFLGTIIIGNIHILLWHGKDVFDILWKSSRLKFRDPSDVERLQDEMNGWSTNPP